MSWGVAVPVVDRVRAFRARQRAKVIEHAVMATYPVLAKLTREQWRDVVDSLGSGNRNSLIAALERYRSSRNGVDGVTRRRVTRGAR